jgi:glycosyltransferase involved in cell wall biosynthesis
MTEARISVLILARDEAANLPDCIASVRWADEVIVVVDAASHDQTEAVARREADQVAVRPFDDFASQRNAALALATGDWVFALDSDERVGPSLAEVVRRTLGERGRPHAGYRVPIRSIILGRPFAYSGTQHDRPLRLFRRGAGHWVGAVHETVEIAGSVGELPHPIQHQTIPDMHTFLRKINEYTSLEALAFDREGRRWRPTDLALRPIWTFVKLYVGKQGFRDGLEGFAFCALSGVSVAVRHWKHRERLQGRGVA